VGTRACRFGRAGTSDDREAAEVDLDRAAVGEELGAEQLGGTVAAGGARPARERLAVVPDGEREVGARERMAAHRLDAVGELGRLALQELAARRGAEEELADVDRRADRARRGAQLAAARVDRRR